VLFAVLSKMAACCDPDEQKDNKELDDDQTTELSRYNGKQ
jgi:hypothetical protein